MEQSLQTKEEKRVIFFFSCSTFFEWLPTSWSWWENVSSSELPSMSSMKNDKWKERSSKILLFFSRFFPHHSQFASSHHHPSTTVRLMKYASSFFSSFLCYLLLVFILTHNSTSLMGKKEERKKKFIFLDSRTWELSTTTLNDIKYHECGAGALLSSGMLCWTSSKCVRATMFSIRIIMISTLFPPLNSFHPSARATSPFFLWWLAEKKNKKSNICCYWCLPTDSRR